MRHIPKHQSHRGANKVNIWTVHFNGGPLGECRAVSAGLYSAVRADHNLEIDQSSISLAFLDTTQYAQVGDLSSSANYANAHAYLNDKYAPQWSMNINCRSQSSTHEPADRYYRDGLNTDPNDNTAELIKRCRRRYTLDT